MADIFMLDDGIRDEISLNLASSFGFADKLILRVLLKKIDGG